MVNGEFNRDYSVQLSKNRRSYLPPQAHAKVHGVIGDLAHFIGRALYLKSRKVHFSTSSLLNKGPLNDKFSRARGAALFKANIFQKLFAICQHRR
jgi:hypothetical protein